MRKLFLGLLAMVATAGTAAAAEPPPRVKITLAEVTDAAGKETLEILDATALAQLQQDLKLEERLYDKAIGLAEKAWKADDFTKAKPFPRAAIGKRSLRPIGTYGTKDAADTALGKEEDRIHRASERRAEQEKKRAELNKNNKNMPQKSNKPSPAEVERAQLEIRAQDMYASKLKELKAAAANPAGTTNQPPAAVEPPPPEPAQGGAKKKPH
jgi:hypothetical protein